MPVNKVTYSGNTLIDLTADTVTANKLGKGITAHDKAGVAITGTADILGYLDSTTKSIRLYGNLADGTYPVMYENVDGKDCELNNLVIAPNYTNLFDPSTASLNNRLNSSATLSAYDGHCVSNWISVAGKSPFTTSTKIYIKGATFAKASNGSQYAKVLSYKTKPSTGYTGIYGEGVGTSLTVTNEGNGVISVSGTGLANAVKSGSTYIIIVLNVKTTAITADDIKDIVITIDEPIT